MSFLDGYTLLNPGSYFQSHDSVAESSRQPRKASSYGSLPSRLIQAAGRPAFALGKLIEDFQTTLPEEAADVKERRERKTILRIQLQNATTIEDWRAAAAELDEVEGNNAWKEQDESLEYNYTLVQSRLQQLDDARISCDAAQMMFLVRTSLSRDLGGMGNIRLYKHTRSGTKWLIERYISSALETMSSLLEITKHQYDVGIDSRAVLEQVLAARQSFGRSALLLSGGGTFGMNHIGVCKCLWEQRLLPRIVSGASAGSIVCAVLGTRTDDEMPRTLDEFCYGDLAVFTPPDGNETALTQVARLLKHGSLFDIGNLTRVMKGLMGDLTFQEAYNRTRRILNITVSSASVFESPKLLNYVTAPNVIIWSAVNASCSVPLIYSAAVLMSKDPRTGAVVPWDSTTQRWIDGSVDNDLPMTRLSEMFNVNHFIVSQVNPHVIPFILQEERDIGIEARKDEASAQTGPGWFSTLANLAKEETMHRMHILSELGVFPNVLSKTRSILSQKYSGDITILPEVPYSQFPRVLTNPTTEFMLQATLFGERATWSKLSRIQNHVLIELALDDAVGALRARIAFSPSQVDLRLNNIARPVSRAGSESGRMRHRGKEHKRARYSDEYDRDGRTEKELRPNSSRPMTIHVDSVDLPARFTPPDTNISSRYSPRRGTPPPKVALQKNNSPIFSTASEADDDSLSDTDTASSLGGASTPRPSNDNAPYVAATSEPWPGTGLFPHASQPSTPHYQQHRRSYFGSQPGSQTSLHTQQQAPVKPTISIPEFSMTASPAPSLFPAGGVQRLNYERKDGSPISPMTRPSSTALKQSSPRDIESGIPRAKTGKKKSVSNAIKSLRRPFENGQK